MSSLKRLLRGPRRVHPSTALWAVFLICSFPYFASAQDAPNPVPVPSPAGPEASAAYADAANLQNHNEFSTAAEEWKKFLEKFPQDPMVPYARHYLGVCYLQQNQLSEAAEQFAAVCESEGDFEFLEESWINWGWCMYSLGIAGDPDAMAQAREIFDRILSRFPADKAALRDQALFYASETNYLTGRHDEAARHYRKLLEEHPDSKQRPDALYALGVLYQEQAKATEALQTFQEFLVDFPDHDLAAEIQLRVGELRMQTKEFEQALAPLQEAMKVQNFPMADVASLRYATCLQCLERYADAVRVYRTFLSQFPNSTYRETARINAAKCLFQLRKWDAATRLLDQIESTDAGLKAEVAHYRSRIEFENGRYDSALAVARSGLAKAPTPTAKARLLLDIGDALAAMPQRWNEAQAVYLKLVQEYPEADEAGQALYNAAYAALDANQFQVALDRSQEFLSKFPGHERNIDVRYIQAETRLMLREYAAAEEAYRSLLRDVAEHPDRANWLARLCVALQAQEKHAEALATTQELESLEQSTGQPAAESIYLTCVSLSEQGQHEQALSTLDRALQGNPRHPLADRMWLLWSALHHRAGRAEQALSGLERLCSEFSESPLVPKALLQRAELAYSLGRFDQAETCYTELRSRFPDSEFIPLAVYGQGWIRLRRERPDEAEALFTEFLERFPKHPQGPHSRQARALARQRQGHWAAALSDCEEFLKTSPQGESAADALYIKALCEIGLKRHDAGEQTLQRILREVPDYSRADQVLYELAWLKRSDDRPRSLLLFEQLVQEHPRSPLRTEALLHLGDAAYSAKDLMSAFHHYQTATLTNASDSLLETALYKLGFVQYKLQELTASRATFTRQLEHAPNGKLAADAKFLVAESWFDESNYANALEIYSQLRDIELSSPSANELKLFHAGQAARELQRYPEALTWLQPLFDKEPPSLLKWRAGFEIAQTMRLLQRLPESEALFQDVADNLRDELGARARFMAGELAFLRKDHDAALKQFQKVMYGYGAEQAPPDVQAWQSKAALEAGRLALSLARGKSDARRREELLGKAQKYFALVVQQAPDSAEAKLAREQLEQLQSSGRVSRAQAP